MFHQPEFRCLLVQRTCTGQFFVALLKCVPSNPIKGGGSSNPPLLLSSTPHTILISAIWCPSISSLCPHKGTFFLAGLSFLGKWVPFCRTKEHKTQNKRTLMGVSPHDVFIVGFIFSCSKIGQNNVYGWPEQTLVLFLSTTRREGIELLKRVRRHITVLVLDMEFPDRCWSCPQTDLSAAV